MSTATADAGAPPVKGKKKLILIVVAAVVLLVVAALAAVLLLRQKAPLDEDLEDTPAPAVAHAKQVDPKHPPAYVPLEAFTVNLADKDADRYAQVTLTLELVDPETADAIKAFMPAVRNNILMVLAHKTAAELLERDGKVQLAQEVRRETARALGVEVPNGDDAEDDAAGARKKRKQKAAPELPVSAVYFSTFIVQ
jgi:flagellar FliL protein